ncbi:terminase small subunit [Lelliottia amnigena]|nr:hypothetical protein CO697_06305 [Lelliottia amnigena]PEG63432.1 hypothetical protein CRH15_16975 [Lelliottia amnigena]QXA21526.1 terminase small subunit [Lelliottia amnigena]
MALTDKQEMFCRVYLIELNATLATASFTALITSQNDG